MVAAPPMSGPTATAIAPGPEDHALLSWREGPPYYTTARYAEERRFLRFETGRWSAELDTIAADLTGFAAVVLATGHLGLGDILGRVLRGRRIGLRPGCRRRRGEQAPFRGIALRWLPCRD